MWKNIISKNPTSRGYILAVMQFATQFTHLLKNILESKEEYKKKCLGKTVLQSETVAYLSANLLLKEVPKKS